MIPLRDDNPTRSFAFVTVVIIAVNALVFVYEITLPSADHLQALVADFGLVSARLVKAPTLAACQTVFTSMFLHGGWMHLIGNMWFLWIFGNNIEDSMGHVRFVLFYLLCGVAAAGAQIAVTPQSTVPMIGASGAISGVLGAYLLLFPRARVLVLFPIWIFWRVFYVPAVVVLLLWFGLQLLSGVLVLGVDLTGGVAFWAHVGGFVAGLALIPLFKRRGLRLLQ